MAGRRASGARPITLVQTPDVKDPTLQRAFDTLTRAVHELQKRAQAVVLTGDDAPEGLVAAPVGTLYVRTGTTAGARLYVKESDDNAVTGWVVK